MAAPTGTTALTPGVPSKCQGSRSGSCVQAPRGSRLETVAHWDNSAQNPMNPGPTARVPFGPEIVNGYFEYVIDGQDLSESQIEN